MGRTKRASLTNVQPADILVGDNRKTAKMTYLILYKFNNNEKVSAFRETLKGIGDTIFCFHSALFLKSNVPSNDIYHRMLPLFQNGEGHLLITEFDKSKANGWISAMCVKWLDEDKDGTTPQHKNLLKKKKIW